MSLKSVDNILYQVQKKEKIPSKKVINKIPFEKRVNKGNNKEDNVTIKKPSFEYDKEIKQNKKNSFYKTYKKTIWLVSAIFFFLLIVISILILWLNSRANFDNNLVDIQIEGEHSIIGGEKYIYKLIITNNSKRTLESSRLIMDLPENVILGEDNYIDEEIGSIEKEKTITKEIEIQFYGSKDSYVDIPFSFEFYPAGKTEKNVKENKISTLIIETPLNVKVNGPLEATLGNPVRLEVQYGNTSAQTYNDLELRLKLPLGTKLGESYPVADSKNRWYKDILASGESQDIKMMLILEDDNPIDKKIEFDLIFKYNNKSFILGSDSITITGISSKVSVTQSISNGNNVSLGDNLNYELEVKNNSQISIPEAVVKVYIKDDGIINFEETETNDGHLDGPSRYILWSAASIPELKLLEPLETVKISFSLNLYNQEDINFASLNKNFNLQINTTTEVTTKQDDKTVVGKSEMSILVNGDFDIQIVNYHNDPLGKLSSYGPIPPKLNQETSYIVKISIKTILNNIKNSILKIQLNEESVIWTNNVMKTGGIWTYNERTKELEWNLEEISANTGVLIPVQDLVFQVAVKPSDNYLGKSVEILKSYEFMGQDSYTGKKYFEDNTLSITTSTALDTKEGEVGP